MTTTVDGLAAAMQMQPASIRRVIDYLTARYPRRYAADPIDELAITPAQAEAIRDVIAGARYMAVAHCTDLH